MMRLFTGSASYRRYLEASIALALAEIKRDADRRRDDDPRVQRLAAIPESFIDHAEKGTMVLLVGTPNEDIASIPISLFSAVA